MGGRRGHNDLKRGNAVKLTTDHAVTICPLWQDPPYVLMPDTMTAIKSRSRLCETDTDNYADNELVLKSGN